MLHCNFGPFHAGQLDHSIAALPQVIAALLLFLFAGVSVEVEHVDNHIKAADDDLVQALEPLKLALNVFDIRGTVVNHLAPVIVILVKNLDFMVLKRLLRNTPNFYLPYPVQHGTEILRVLLLY